MTEKELRKLTRLQLLELLVVQTEENEKLQKQFDDLKKRRTAETVRFSKLGSVAEAAVQISGVMDAAQKTADIYLATAKKRADTIIKDARRKADEIISHANKEAENLFGSEKCKDCELRKKP